MKKKITALFLLALMTAFIFSGCSNSGSNNTTSSQTTTSQSASAVNNVDHPDIKPISGQKQFVIGFSNFGVGNSWRVQMEAEFKSEADKLKAAGVISDYYMTDSNGDIAKQIADMNDLITKKCDAIIITAASPTALSPVCEQAEAAGIKVVSFDNAVSTDKITAKVNIDDNQFGATGAQWLADKLNGKGNIVVLNGISGTDVNNNRWNGAKSVLDKYPDIKILGDANADWDYAKGKAAVENFLSAYPTIDGVYSQGGAMTQAALDAFIAAGRPLVPMAGEANNGLLKEWKANASKGFDSIAPCEPTYLSAYALDVAVQALQGQSVQLNTVATLPVIDSNNLDQYIRTDLPDSFWNFTWLSADQIAQLYSK
ncbi:MAG: ABC transporter substrate-binding protein [Oscillospiraceae bacterium]|nr:ABC transporter substrate-binding protein [Oscillospiraceae bacterium]